MVMQAAFHSTAACSGALLAVSLGPEWTAGTSRLCLPSLDEHSRLSSNDQCWPMLGKTKPAINIGHQVPQGQRLQCPFGTS